MSINNRLTELDVLRGIAALSVVLYHYINRYDALYGHEKENYYLDFQFGYLGVELFFIISGFVIFMTLQKCSSIKTFVFKRAVRLYPAYIVAVILTFSTVLVFGLNGREVSLYEGVINLTMLQGFFTPFGVVSHVDGVYWSLAVELIFYILMGVLFVTGNLRGEKPLIFWLLIAFLVSGLNVYVSNFAINGLLYYGILKYCHLFIAGIMFYKLKSNNRRVYHFIIALCLTYQFTFNDMIEGIVVSGFFLIFYLLIFNKLTFINNKPIAFLGTISYSLYLVHQNIGYIIINALEDKGLIHEVFILVPLSISIIIATVITFLIEKPIQKFLMSKKKPSTRQKVAA